MLDELDMYRQYQELYHIGPRKSIVDFHTSEHVDEADFEVRGNILSRRNSAACGIGGIGPRHSLLSSSVGNLETLDDVANAASQHSALYSYHYIDGTDNTVLFDIFFCLFISICITNT